MKNVDPLQRQKRKKNGKKRKKNKQKRERGRGKKGENKIKLESVEERRARFKREASNTGREIDSFFDEKKDGARNSIVCFGASIPCHAI